MPDIDVASSPDIQPPPTSLNPFDGMKSDDEEEELAVPDRPEEELDEVDEKELEAFLDGQLENRLSLLQEGSRQGIAFENQEHNAFGLPTSKAEDALRTCKLHVKGSVRVLFVV